MSQIQLTSAMLTSKANELSAQNTQLKAQISLLDETEQRLNSMWEGEANTAFHAAFQRDKSQMTNFYTAIEQYVQVMRSVAARYAKAESTNTTIASTRNY